MLPQLGTFSTPGQARPEPAWRSKRRQPMSTEQNKTHANQFVEEVINAGQVGRATAFFVTDYVDHAPVPPRFPTGVAGLQQYFTLFRAAFPDLHYTVEDTVAEGDKVVQGVS